MTRVLHDGRDDGLQPLESLDLQNTQRLCRFARGHVQDGVRRPRVGRGLPGPLRHGGRPRLHPRADHFRGHEHRQDGARRLPDDRRRPRADRDFHGRHPRPRSLGGNRLRPLQARSRGLRQAALRMGLQPRLRHPGDGIESLAGPADRQPGPGGTRLVAADLLVATEWRDRAKAL